MKPTSGWRAVGLTCIEPWIRQATRLTSCWRALSRSHCAKGFPVTCPVGSDFDLALLMWIAIPTIHLSSSRAQKDRTTGSAVPVSALQLNRIEQDHCFLKKASGGQSIVLIR